jgi:glyoxylate carboligase
MDDIHDHLHRNEVDRAAVNEALRGLAQNVRSPTQVASVAALAASLQNQRAVADVLSPKILEMLKDLRTAGEVDDETMEGLASTARQLAAAIRLMTHTVTVEREGWL